MTAGYNVRAGALLASLLVICLACGGPNSSTATASGKSSSGAAVDCRDPNLPGGVQSPGASVRYETLTTAGALRDFRLFVSPALDLKSPVPLVIQLHGSPATAATFQGITHFDDEATKGKFLAAYPDGCDGYWNAGRCCTTKADDVAFISAVMDRLESEFLIDKSRIFLVGSSAGSMMGYRLACELSSRIAGLASDAGTMVIDVCLPSRPVPIFEMHGTADADIPYGGGRASIGVDGPSVASVIQEWVQLDGCAGSPSIIQAGITKTSDWTNCKNRSVVRLDTVVGGLHQWFGSDYAAVAGEPDFSSEAWGFLSSLRPST